MNAQQIEQLFNIFVSIGVILSIGLLLVAAFVDVRRGINEAIRKSHEGTNILGDSNHQNER